MKNESERKERNQLAWQMAMKWRRGGVNNNGGVKRAGGNGSQQ